MKHGYNSMYPKTSLKAIIRLHIISPRGSSKCTCQPPTFRKKEVVEVATWCSSTQHDLRPQDQKDSISLPAITETASRISLRIRLNPSSKKQERNSFFNKASLNIINVNTRGGVIRQGWEMMGTVPQTTVTNYTSLEQSQKQRHQTIFTCPNFKNTRSCTLKTQEKKKQKNNQN